MSQSSTSEKTVFAPVENAGNIPVTEVISLPVVNSTDDVKDTTSSAGAILPVDVKNIPVTEVILLPVVNSTDDVKDTTSSAGAILPVAPVSKS